MKRLLLLMPLLLMARENPFFLPDELPQKGTQNIRKMSKPTVVKQKTLPNKVLQPSKREAVRKELLRLSIKPATISIYTNHLVVKTGSKLLRSFFTTKPKKLVLDFASHKSFGSIKKGIQGSLFFEDIAVGSHKGYFRIALRLKKGCAKKIEKATEGYLIFCK